jgi:hypothetical protein
LAIAVNQSECSWVLTIPTSCRMRSSRLSSAACEGWRSQPSAGRLQ